MKTPTQMKNIIPGDDKRDIQVKFYVSRAERDLIDERMEQAGTTNMGAYLRKMSLDGYLLRLELPELKEMISLLRRCSNNLNQLAKRAHETGRIYSEDIEDVSTQLDKLWNAARAILSSLAKIS